jgi:hypothetical protein
MDIAGYIGDLLFEHDCIIVPGFGGFVCRYLPAQIQQSTYAISPPSKAISFNVNLQANDGLLVNYIAQINQINFDESLQMVQTWVASAAGLLKSNNELILNAIGTFSRDAEGNLQFTPNEGVNYLKSSFGLKTITAKPVIRGKVATLKPDLQENVTRSIPRRTAFKVAAIILLVAGIAAAGTLMWKGIEIKSLNLNEANVLSLTDCLVKPPVPLKPILPAPASPSTEIHTSAIESSTQAPEQATEKKSNGYYIIIGAFSVNSNVEAARLRLLKTVPPKSIYIKRVNGLTRVGYYAGNDEATAQRELRKAQVDNGDFWLSKD